MSCILAAIDDSAAAQPVLATKAAALAPAFGATVTAVHVADEVGDTAKSTAAQFSVPVRVRSGDPFEVITTLAADPEVIAVVVGTRGLPGGRRGTWRWPWLTGCATGGDGAARRPASGAGPHRSRRHGGIADQGTQPLVRR